jgi:hypothetical protein
LFRISGFVLRIYITIIVFFPIKLSYVRADFRDIWCDVNRYLPLLVQLDIYYRRKIMRCDSLPCEVSLDCFIEDSSDYFIRASHPVIW